MDKILKGLYATSFRKRGIKVKSVLNTFILLIYLNGVLTCHFAVLTHQLVDDFDN